MRALAFFLVVAACYTGGTAAPPPAQSPPAPPARQERAPRSTLHCPPQSRLQLDGSSDTAYCMNTETGRKDGPRVIYFPDGTVAAEEQWQDGQRSGRWRTFWQNGKVSHERTFADGQEASHRAFDEGGRPRELPPLADDRCTTDSDCKLGFAGPECCAPESFCGVSVSRAREQSVTDRCFGVYCGRPVPSSSCLGIRGAVPKCVSGRCAL